MSEIKPDLTKIRDHGVSGNRFSKWKKTQKINVNDPFIVRYNNNDKLLSYIGTKHTNDPTSKTFSLIKNNIVGKDLVIVEGVPFGKGISPVLTFGGGGEMEYAMKLAIKHKISYSGVEPTYKVLYAKTIKHGIGKKDIILLECLRQYKIFAFQWKKPENDFREDMQHLLTYLFKILHIKKFVFDKVFKKTIGVDFEYGKTDPEIASPDKDGKYYTNKISAMMAQIRELEIIQNIYKYINQCNNILIIYGQNHFYSDMKILEKTFGKGLVN